MADVKQLLADPSAYSLIKASGKREEVHEINAGETLEGTAVHQIDALERFVA